MTPPSLHKIALAVGGEVDRHRVRFAPPGHSKADRSAWVEPAPNLPDGFYIGTFATGDDPIFLKDYVRARLGLCWRGIKSWSTNAQPAQQRARSDANRTAQAINIWQQARDPRDTPVQTHLRRRGVALPEEAAGAAIRFHENCPFGNTRTPAMLCLVRNIITNASQAVHRTALSHDGCKIKINGRDRLSLGPTDGGAIKITPDEDVTTCLGIAEGLETTLSFGLFREFGHSPVWALLSANGIAKFPVLSGIETVWIGVDHDPAGINAARATAERWRVAGWEVLLIQPKKQSDDLNDIVKGAVNG